MQTRATKRTAEEALAPPQALHNELFDEAVRNKLAACDARNNQLAEAQNYFEQAKNGYLNLISLLHDKVYFRVPASQNLIMHAMTEQNRADIFRYIEVITSLGELLLAFEAYDDAEKYLLEYMRFRAFHQNEIGDDVNDSLCNDYFNLGIIYQVRFNRSNDPSHLSQSTEWFIKALATYRSIAELGECHDCAKDILNNFISQIQLEARDFTLMNDSIKDIIVRVIANVLSINQLNKFSNSTKNLTLFLAQQRWEKPISHLKGMMTRDDKNAIITKIVALQKEFMPEIFVKDNLTNVKLYGRQKSRASKIRKNESANANELPTGYSMWAPSPAAPATTPIDDQACIEDAALPAWNNAFLAALSPEDEAELNKLFNLNSF